MCVDVFPTTLCKPKNPNTRKGREELILTVPAKLMCGGVAGAIAQTIAYVFTYKYTTLQWQQFLSLCFILSKNCTNLLCLVVFIFYKCYINIVMF